MRAVIAIKSTGGSGASRATRYISERDRNPEREGTKPRPLFSDREDTLTYRGADCLLSNGTGSPDKADLIHIAVSFRHEDYERLGTTDDERKDQLREVTREALGEMSRELRAKEMRWVAGIHLNTNHPHVHIVISKDIKDIETDKSRRIGKIPKRLLPYREVQADGSTRPAVGRIGNHFVAALDRHIDQAREMAERNRQQSRVAGDARGAGEWLRREARARDVAALWGAPDRVSDGSQVRQDRVVLGEAMEKSLRREYAALAYEKALKQGETFRFRARDESSGAERQISEADVKRRADARGSRAAAEQNLHTAVERQQVRQQVSERDVALHGTTISELRKIRSNLLERLGKELSRATLEHTQAQARAGGLRQQYAARGQELPAPIIARDTLVEMQEQAIRLGLADRVETLEQLRVALAVENGQPTRNDQDVARLGAQLFTARTELDARQERLAGFDQMRHLQRWDINGERWSLTDLDRQIEWQTDQSRVVGRYHFHIVPSERQAAGKEAARLVTVRDELVKRIDERRNELLKETGDARKLVEVLTRAHERETASCSLVGRAMPPPEFTCEELSRIEANAEATRDAGLLKRLNEFEKRFNGRDLHSERQTPEERLGRAMAREIIAEVAYRESAERLATFNERGDVQPLAIESKDGRINVRQLKDTRPHSVVERALRPLVERPAARETRLAIEAASANSQAHLATAYGKSRAYLGAAREIAANLRTELREQVTDKTHLAPAFTPKERINLEIYAERQADPQARAHYLSLARSEMIQATPVHDAPGNRFAHDRVSQIDHGRASGQSPAYDSHARSTGRAR
jgi:diadenosine tetraphosphate (Ap4A) HIT family hydrolase